MLDDLIRSINSLYPLLWFGFPLALLYEASKRLQNFHDQHRQNKVLVADKYDDQNFNKVIKPLYSRVNQILTEKMVLAGNRPTRISEAALRDYEAKKESLLSTQDISQFEESVEFAQMQDEIINAKKSKYNHGLLYKQVRHHLWMIIILAIVQALIAISSFIVNSIAPSSEWLKWLLLAWAAIAILVVLVTARYLYKDIELRNYGED